MPESESAVQLRAAHRDQAILRHGASSTCWPIECSRRTSTRAASSRISTSSPAQASSSVNFPRSAWGCDGGPSDTIGHGHGKQRSATASYDPAPASTIRRWATNSIRPGCRGRYYTSSINGDGDIWSAYQAIKHIRYGPDWKQNVITPQTQFLQRRRQRQLADGELGHADVRELRSRRLRLEHGPGVGGVAGQRDRHSRKYWNSTAIFIMWDDYGGWYDHVPPPLRRLRRTRHAHSAARHLAVCQEGLRLARAVRARQHLQVRRGPVRSAAAVRQRQARELAGKRLLRLQRSRRGRSCRFQRAEARLFPDSETARPCAPPDNE